MRTFIALLFVSLAVFYVQAEDAVVSTTPVAVNGSTPAGSQESTWDKIKHGASNIKDKVKGWFSGGNNGTVTGTTDSHLSTTASPVGNAANNDKTQQH